RARWLGSPVRRSRRTVRRHPRDADQRLLGNPARSGPSLGLLVLLLGHGPDVMIPEGPESALSRGSPASSLATPAGPRLALDRALTRRHDAVRRDGDHRTADRSGPGVEEGAGACVERRPGGRHVVYEEDRTAAHDGRVACAEGPRDVGGPGRPIERGLPGRLTRSHPPPRLEAAAATAHDARSQER